MTTVPAWLFKVAPTVADYVEYVLTCPDNIDELEQEMLGSWVIPKDDPRYPRD